MLKPQQKPKPKVRRMKGSLKSGPVTKRVGPEPKKDLVSETISFVIKGKLTPIKAAPTFPAGKKSTRKMTKGVIKKIEATPKKVKKPVKVVKKTIKVLPVIEARSAKRLASPAKNEPMKKEIKNDGKKDVKSDIKCDVKKDLKADEKKEQVKNEIKTELKKEVLKNEAVKNEEKNDEKNEGNNEGNDEGKNEAKKETRKVTKSKEKKKVEPVKKTKEAKSVGETKKRGKSPQKSEADKLKALELKKAEEKAEEIKSKTIEKLLKQANRALKTQPIKKSKVKAKQEKGEPKKKEAEAKNKKPIKRKNDVPDDKAAKKIKNEPAEEKKPDPIQKKKPVTKVKPKVLPKKKMKLFKFWNGPKRHRVASLNALAKVHCLYENETRGSLLEDSSKSVKVEENEEVPSTRTLRSVPGLRAIGKHWDMHDTTTSSSDSDSSVEDVKPVKKQLKKEETTKKAETKRRRNRTELIMDLKDMVVRKRMASLNASAILAASYSVEKRPAKSPRSQSETEDSSDYFVTTDNEEEMEEAKKLKSEEIELSASPNKKVAVILNQDTDVTITGVYVNSTTRSTHHEGFCSIAGMQYRISATSHTQTAATAVATETLLQSSSSSTQENSNSESLTSCKSYTPLDALSNMQPPPGPGVQHGHPQHMGPPQHHVLPPLPPQHQLSPGRRHGCPSAFTAPHAAPPYTHHHPPPPMPGDPGYVHGYYQPAGPLINVPHGHTQPPPPPLTKSAPLSEASPTSAASPIHQPGVIPPPPAPSSIGGDSSDSEVIITSVTAGTKEPPSSAAPQQQQPPPPSGIYRYSTAPQYPTAIPPPPPGAYSYYPPHYAYPTPPPPPAPPSAYAHHDLCYPSPYLTAHHKYGPPTAYHHRRYLTPSAQYYAAPNPPDIYSTPPGGGGPQPQNQQVVTATPVSATSGSSYQASPNGPPPTLMEPYPPPQPPPPPPPHTTLVETFPPHPAHYYPGYGPAAPPPSCYTHSPQTRTIPYINATYQSCPCPMQSCPKNVLTGPLTGDSKRSNIAKDSMPLPPVALALPLEPASATGPPSPARGSAGMPPPPSPAGATYQPPPPAPKQESQSPEATTECNTINPLVEKKRKARVGKAMVRNNIAAIQQHHTMLLMCNPSQRPAFPSEVKREIESPPKEKDTYVEEKKAAEEPPPPMIVIEDVGENLKKEQEQQTEKPKEVEVLEPIVSTVAENVKVKNMKRKLSLSKEPAPTPVVAEPSPKKAKVGSYKDLIKKDNTNVTLKINNKRKLLDEDDQVKSKTNKGGGGAKKRKKSREAAATEENANNKKKNTKPLMASNVQNSKNYSNSKEKVQSEPLQSENKEPLPQQQQKLTTTKKQSKAAAAKKTAPALLDSLIAKNSIDRTIDTVVSDPQEPKMRTKEKCAKQKDTNTTKSTKSNGQIKMTTTTNHVNKANGKLAFEIPAPPAAAAAAACPQRNTSVGVNRRKCKANQMQPVPLAVARVPRRSLQFPKWSNGWRWEGDAYDCKVFLNSDETTVIRKCYPAMRHEEGDIIEVKDCVLLKAGAKKNDLPFVAKIAYLWENPDDGEMWMSLLWYYRPEHTEQGRLPADQPDEVFASRHKDSNSVACIDDKCYVLTFLEYCRYRKNLKRLEEKIAESSPCIPIPEPYPRSNRQPPPGQQISPEMVFFCRRVYDFRQKRIVKNPS